MLAIVIGIIIAMGIVMGLVAFSRKPHICSVFPMGATPLVRIIDGGVVPYRMAWSVLPTDDVLVQFAMPGWAVEDVDEARVSGRTLYVRVDTVRLMRGVPAPHVSFKVAVPKASRVSEVVVLPLQGRRGRRVPRVAYPMPVGHLAF